jgi:hypothetical protein
VIVNVEEPETATMMGPIARYLADDHARLDALLMRSASDPAAYEDFRKGLLRHIGMGEKLLLPAAQRARGGEPLPAAARLRLITEPSARSSCRPPPRRSGRRFAAYSSATTRSRKGRTESTPRANGWQETRALLASLRAFPEVSVSPHVDSDLVERATRRALVRAGYAFDDFEV